MAKTGINRYDELPERVGHINVDQHRDALGQALVNLEQATDLHADLQKAEGRIEKAAIAAVHYIRAENVTLTNAFSVVAAMTGITATLYGSVMFVYGGLWLTLVTGLVLMVAAIVLYDRPERADSFLAAGESASPN
ncbi:hypothetical protein G3I44_14325 [Halogeometricum borinquense]|uniref:DUF2335 domain-containing protein n=1 Tax=Halogeometricum borinquense TaxID=60847 RepID=A0A6C0UIP7_9EURY|nr:hypothetical protein [Halogeometricum borinquense]QIB75362.1 hypothetical protein G3I44_14325 [Halogeometricum borinquense]